MSVIVNPYSFATSAPVHIIAAIQNVASNPKCFYSTDEGQNWSSGNSITTVGYTAPRNLRIAHGDHNKMLFVINNTNLDNIAFYSTNKGIDFSAASTTDAYMFGCALSSNGQVMVVTRSHNTEGSWYSTNSGTNWSSAGIVMDNPRAVVIDADGSECYVHSLATTSWGMYSTNTCSSWNSFTGPPHVVRDACASDNLGYIYTLPNGEVNAMKLSKTTDKYATASSSITIATPTGTFYGGIDCSGSGQYVCVQCYQASPNQGRIYVSNNYGSSGSWTEVTSGITASDLYTANSPRVSYSGKYITVSTNQNGKFYFSTDYGVTFSAKTITGFGSYTVNEVCVQD